MANPFTGITGPQTLLIVAPDAFVAALAPLIAHKNASGMPATLVSISAITAFFPGADDPEKIKRAIQFAHEQLSTSYVMLVGDAHQFPVRFYFMHKLTGQLNLDLWMTRGTEVCTPYGDWIPSDLYYANLYHHSGKYPAVTTGAFDTWDANNNGLYNEGTWLDPYPLTLPHRARIRKGASWIWEFIGSNADDVDGYPDVAIGRVPAHTAQDVTAYVNKIIAYESPPRYLQHQQTFTFVHDSLYGGLDLTTDIVSDSGLMGSNLVSSQLLLIETNLDENCRPIAPSVPPGWTNATPTDVVNAVNVSSWISYIGHGGPQSWGYCGAFIGETQVAETAQNTSLPVVFVAGCSTGRFISDLPWNAEYVDGSGTHHGPFQFTGGTQPGANGPVFVDDFTGTTWGKNCPPPGCNAFPAVLPQPSVYDFDRPDQGFASAWLLANAPGGAIAYFGEVGVASDPMGAELETYMLEWYGHEFQPVLGDIYLKAQQQYWGAHATDTGGGDYHSVSRFYLGWMVLFGDPSLRLPAILNLQ